MARIRSIKPEFPQSESMGRVSRDARLLFVMLWPICDDHGRTRAASRMLASLLFPYDDDAPSLIDGWLDELEREACITRYEDGGSTFLFINNWLKHQKIDKPSKPLFPEPSIALANPREDSLLEGKGREGKGEEKAQPKPAPDGDFYSGVPEQVVHDFKQLRQRLRAPITATAMEGIRRESGKAGITLAAALTMCCERGWRGFKAEWVNGAPASPAPPPRKRKQLGEGSSTNYGGGA